MCGRVCDLVCVYVNGVCSPGAYVRCVCLVDVRCVCVVVCVCMFVVCACFVFVCGRECVLV